MGFVKSGSSSLAIICSRVSTRDKAKDEVKTKNTRTRDISTEKKSITTINAKTIMIVPNSTMSNVDTSPSSRNRMEITVKVAVSPMSGRHSIIPGWMILTNSGTLHVVEVGSKGITKAGGNMSRRAFMRRMPANEEVGLIASESIMVTSSGMDLPTTTNDLILLEAGALGQGTKNTAAHTKTVAILVPTMITTGDRTTPIIELKMDTKDKTTKTTCSNQSTTTPTLFILALARLRGACLPSHLMMNTKSMQIGGRNCLKKWSILHASCAQRPTKMSDVAICVTSRASERSGKNSKALHLPPNLLWRRMT